jgi:hypothetical protein
MCLDSITTSTKNKVIRHQRKLPRSIYSFDLFEMRRDVEATRNTSTIWILTRPWISVFGGSEPDAIILSDESSIKRLRQPILDGNGSRTGLN